MAESEPLWKACADWLCRLEVLPENHRILLPDANIEDLGKFWIIIYESSFKIKEGF